MGFNTFTVRTDEYHGQVQHMNGTATTTPVEVQFTKTIQTLFLENVGTTAMQISFDGAANWKRLMPGGWISVDGEIDFFHHRTESGDTNFEGLLQTTL